MSRLYPHQVQGCYQAIERLKSDRGFYLNWEPGCGKTLGALLVAKHRNLKRIAVLTPVVGLGVWAREVEKWWPEAGFRLLRGDVTDVTVHVPGLWGQPLVAATNYEQLLGTGGRPRLKTLTDFQPELLVLDEAQYIKSPSASRTRAVQKLATVSEKLLLMSGTQAHNPLDWWTQYRLIDPTNPFWRRTYGAYKSWIARPHPRVQFAIDGFWPENLAQAKAEVLKTTHVASMADLPAPRPIETPVYFTLTPHEHRVYSEMERYLFAQIDALSETEAPIVLTKYLRLHQITGGFVTDTQGSTRGVGVSKLQTCLDVIDLRPTQKILVACRFRAEIEVLRAFLKKRNRPVMEITGDTTPAERARIERDFQESSEPFVLLLQYRAGGMALTLTEAKALIFYSFEPSVIAYRQMYGRIWRLTSQHACQVLPLLAEGTLDERIWTGLQQGFDGVDLARYLRGNHVP